MASLPEKSRGNLATQWKPGQSGNPAGKPKGARHKLGEAFLEAMHQDFKAYGSAVVAQVREEKPDQYLKVIASILPKQLTNEDGAALVVSSFVDPLLLEPEERETLRMLLQAMRERMNAQVIEHQGDE